MARRREIDRQRVVGAGTGSVGWSRTVGPVTERRDPHDPGDWLRVDVSRRACPRVAYLALNRVEVRARVQDRSGGSATRVRKYCPERLGELRSGEWPDSGYPLCEVAQTISLA